MGDPGLVALPFTKPQQPWHPLVLLRQIRTLWPLLLQILEWTADIPKKHEVGVVCADQIYHHTPSRLRPGASACEKLSGAEGAGVS